MRRLSVIAMAVVLAVAGLAAVAWQGPRALDWSHLEPRLQEALGREVSLDGPVRLDLLPRPVLTVGGISAIDISVREVRAVLDTGALLAGSLEIDRLELSGVELTFDRSLVRPLPPLPVQHIRFEDSSIAFGDALVPVETATLTVRGPEGPYRLEAKAALEGRRIDVAASVGKWRDRTSVTVSVGGGGIEAVAAGAVEKNPAAGFVFSGRFSLRGAAGSAWNGTFDSEFLLGPDGARFTGIDAVVADQRFTGALRTDWRGGTEIEARLSTRTLLFDRWRDLLPQLAGSTAGASLRLALNAGAVKFGDRTARKVEAAFQGDADGFRMERLAAVLPGGTRLEMAGEGHEHAAFSLKTGNLRALLHWLGIDPGAVEEARLRGLEADGRLRLAGRGVSPEALRTRLESADFALEEVRGRIDGARIEGGFARQGEQFEARLEAEDLPLDAYRPAFEGRGLYSGRLHLELARTRLLGVPVARLQLAAEQGGDGETVLARLAVEDAGGLSGEASGRFGGEAASFEVAGRTTDLDRSARLYGFPLPVVARGLGAAEFEGRGDGLPDLLPIDFRADAGGRSLRLSGELAERRRFLGRIEFEGPLPPGLQLPENDSPAMAAASVSAERDRADFTDIDIRLGTARMQGKGSLSLDGERPAARVALAADRVDLPAPSLNVPVWRRRPFETGRFGAFDLELELGADALGIGGEVLEDVKLDLSLSPEAWLVKAATAGWRGGRLAFDGYLTGEGRALLKMRVRDAVLPERMDFGPSGARTGGFLGLAAEGHSLHDMASTLSGTASFDFSGGRLAGVSAAAARSALEGAPTSAELLRRLRNALVSGDSALVSGRLEARIRGGVAEPVAGSFALSGGQVAISGSVDLRRRLVDLTGRVAFPGRPETPPLGFSIAGPLHDPDRRPEVGAVEAILLTGGVAGLVRPNAN
ncbi:MAG: hypothetical protein OXN81_17465 [Alphaproteobacteria bacterium]|nr:hypothetical protein [Alphaproteobacteria bacterium]